MRQIAVLFDAENVAAGCIGQVLSQLAPWGQVSTAKAVGDFSEPMLGAWKSEASRSGVMLVLQPSLGKGKNAADIRLAIEAMDLAHRGGVDGIALVSDDRDFTPLALQLRSMGLEVHGFGTPKAPAGFQAACSRFTCLPDKDGPSVTPGKTAVPAAGQPVLSAADRQELIKLVQALSEPQTGRVDPAQIGSKLAQANPQLFKRLKGGKGLMRRLVGSGIVEQVSVKPARLRLMPLRVAG